MLVLAVPCFLVSCFCFLSFPFSRFHQGVAERLVDMVADVSKEANEVFGYADDASTGGDQLG